MTAASSSSMGDAATSTAEAAAAAAAAAVDDSNDSAAAAAAAASSSRSLLVLVSSSSLEENGSWHSNRSNNNNSNSDTNNSGEEHNSDGDEHNVDEDFSALQQLQQQLFNASAGGVNGDDAVAVDDVQQNNDFIHTGSAEEETDDRDVNHHYHQSVAAAATTTTTAAAAAAVASGEDPLLLRSNSNSSSDSTHWFEAAVPAPPTQQRMAAAAAAAAATTEHHQSATQTRTTTSSAQQKRSSPLDYLDGGEDDEDNNDKVSKSNGNSTDDGCIITLRDPPALARRRRFLPEHSELLLPQQRQPPRRGEDSNTSIAGATAAAAVTNDIGDGGSRPESRGNNRSASDETTEAPTVTTTLLQQPRNNSPVVFPTTPRAAAVEEEPAFSEHDNGGEDNDDDDDDDNDHPFAVVRTSSHRNALGLPAPYLMMRVPLGSNNATTERAVAPGWGLFMNNDDAFAVNPTTGVSAVSVTAAAAPQGDASLVYRNALAAAQTPLSSSNNNSNGVARSLERWQVDPMDPVRTTSTPRVAVPGAAAAVDDEEGSSVLRFVVGRRGGGPSPARPPSLVVGPRTTGRRTFSRTPARSAGTERVGGAAAATAPPPPNIRAPPPQPPASAPRPTAATAARQRVVHRVRVPRGSLVTMTLQLQQLQQQQEQHPPLDDWILIPVSELRPQVLPDAEQEHISADDDAREESRDLERFKCAICFDFLDHPVGCGTCSGRFCRECLQQVLQLQKQQQRHIILNTSYGEEFLAKCPTCRSTFSLGTPDFALFAHMAAVSVPCRYIGCTSNKSNDGQQTMIFLPLIKLHEAEECSSVRVCCRYAVYGCEWKGRRAAEEAHEKSDCALAKISGLLEQLRVGQINQHRDVVRLKEQVNSLLAVLRALDCGVQSAVIYDQRNPLDVVSFVATAMLTTPRGIMCNKVPWKPMYHTPDGRATVFNKLAMLPTMLVIVKTVLEGVHYHAREWTWDKVVLLLHQKLSPIYAAPSSDGGPSAEALDAASDLYHNLLRTWLIGLCGCAIILFSHLDNASPRSWRVWQPTDVMRALGLRNNLPAWLGDGQRGCTHGTEVAVSASIFLVYYAVADNSVAAILLWCSVAVGSWVLPAALHKLSALIATEDGAAVAYLGTGLLRHGRVSRPLFMGMKYGLLFQLLGLHTCLDAIFLFVVAIHGVWQKFGIDKLETFRPFEDVIYLLRSTALNKEIGTVYLGARLAVILRRYHSGELLANVIFRMLSAFCLLIAVDVFFQALTTLGDWLGDKVHAKTQQFINLAQLNNSDGTPRVSQNETIGLGILVFAVWVGSLALITAI